MTIPQNGPNNMPIGPKLILSPLAQKMIRTYTNQPPIDIDQLAKLLTNHNHGPYILINAEDRHIWEPIKQELSKRGIYIQLCNRNDKHKPNNSLPSDFPIKQDSNGSPKHGKTVFNVPSRGMWVTHYLTEEVNTNGSLPKKGTIPTEGN